MSEPRDDPVGVALTRGGTVARKFLTDFRDFILRGNIVDLAVGGVIGVAFNALVSEFTKDMIHPLISRAGGGGVFSGSFKVHHQTFYWAAFVNAVVHFLIVAADVFYFVVKPMNVLLKRVHRNNIPPPESPPTEETRVLREIRDIMLADRGVREA